jgi:predicted sugar kinase
MFIEIGAPCILPLGLALVEAEGRPKTCLMGITLQHPPTQLFACADQRLDVTGARAQVARRYAQRFLGHHSLESSAAIEIELATYSHMGLGSNALLGLSTAKGLAWVNQLPTDDTLALARALNLAPQHALDVWGFDQGGFLLVETLSEAKEMPQIVRRHPIQAADSKDDWVFVFFLPKAPTDIPSSWEAERLSALLSAAPWLDVETLHQTTQDLWSALISDDLETFARSLMEIQALNREALAGAGTPEILSDKEQRILDLMRDHGALAWGRSFTGLGLYGLIGGAKPSVALRQAMRPHIDFHSGTLMATITDNEGARHTIRDGVVSDYLLPGG